MIAPKNPEKDYRFATFQKQQKQQQQPISQLLSHKPPPNMPPRNTRTSRITDTSPHTSFVDRAGFKIMYVTVLVALWALLHASHAVTNAGEAWNWVLRIHAVVSYVFFHWIKGAPETGMLEDEKLQLMTFWEQIDEGYFGTPSRRFLTFVPFGVFFVTLMLNVQHDDLSTLVVNALFTLVCLVPKLESFFKVRIFGINKD